MMENPDPFLRKPGWRRHPLNIIKLRIGNLIDNFVIIDNETSFLRHVILTLLNVACKADQLGVFFITLEAVMIPQAVQVKTDTKTTSV